MSAVAGPLGCTVIVMAKAPEPGYAKTRLVPALGPAGAARLAARFLEHTLAQALAAHLGPVRLACAPSARHPAFARWQGHAGLALEDQAPGDLGQRMAHAFDSALLGSERALLIGTDAPALDAARLAAAAEALVSERPVFVPTFDGGYVLVGLTRGMRSLWPALFEAMPWSTREVMPTTRTRLAALGMEPFELAPVADVDEPADLVHVPPRWL